MRICCALSLVCLAAGASAQSRTYVELGAMFPAYDGAHFGKDLGPSAGLGYSFLERGNLTFSAEVRVAYHDVTVGGGASGNSGPTDNSLTWTSGAVVLRYRQPGARFFSGVGLGVGRADLQDHAGKTDAIVSLEGGYDLTKSVYVVARYQFSGQDALRGANLSLGFRF